MHRILRNITLPLLLKELIEQASRRRTYVIRIIYVSLFFLACTTVVLPEFARTGNGPLGMLGVGRNIFMYIVGWQFAGIYLFLPALTCGVVTIEKERNTLGLLFLTRLGPWTIVWEKLLSRLLPMYCLLLCSLPLLAFTISLGGVDMIDIFSAVWFVTLTAFQVSAIAVACSAFFRTTTAALLSCYATLFLVIFGLPIINWLLLNDGLRYAISLTIDNWQARSGTPPPTFNNHMYADVVLYGFFGFLQFMMNFERSFGVTSTLMFRFVMGLPLILSGLIPLAVARFFLIRRAFVPPKNLVLIVLRWADRCFHALNNNPITKGIVIFDQSHSQPDFDPIAWRETHKRSLGQTTYLIRILLALEVPVVLVIMMAIFRAASDYYGMDGVVNVMTVLTWAIVALLITISSSSLIAGERGRQTLDILLTIPMTGRQIILDKISGVRRLTWVCAVPLITCICFEAWWRDVIGTRSYSSSQHNYVWWNYLLTALSLVVTYLPLLSWLSIWIGLKTKSPTRATLAALITVVAWCVLPIIAILMFWAIFVGGSSFERDGYLMLVQLSPLGLLLECEFDSLSKLSEIPLLPMFVNMLLYGTICLLLRKWVLDNADRLLGRAPPTDLKVKQMTDGTEALALSRAPSFVE